MAIKLLSTLFDFAPGTIVRDLSYDIERRIVARGAGSYDLSGGTEATVATLNPNLSDVERRILLLEELLLTNRNTSGLEPFAVSDWVLQGIYDYNDLATATTPIAIPNTGAYVYIPNDGQGAFTNKTYALPGIADIWDVANQQFDFSNLSLGDTIDIRLDMVVTTTAPTQEIDVDLEMAIGSPGGAYDIDFYRNIVKSAGAYDVNRWTSVYMGNEDTLNYPAKLKVRSDDTASAVVRGWYVRVLPRFAKFQL